MIAVHLDPGPEGYAVFADEDSTEPLAAGLTRENAVLLVRDGQPIEPKFMGNTSGYSRDSYGRTIRHVTSHNQAQAPWDWIGGSQ